MNGCNSCEMRIWPLTSHFQTPHRVQKVHENEHYVRESKGKPEDPNSPINTPALENRSLGMVMMSILPTTSRLEKSPLGLLRHFCNLP